MSFRVNQKIGKHVYVYKVESYWDKEKKQSRQKRIYLGKKDSKTGKLIEAQSKFIPTSVLEFGASYFLESILEKVGLNKLIETVFQKRSDEILNLIKFQIIDSSALYLYPQWESSTFLKKKTQQSSQSISDLLIKIGKSNENKVNFFKYWVSKNKTSEGIYYDLTSFSSYSKLIESVEWGYNRDKEKLPQINFGLVLTSDTQIPLYYDIYPGSINDSKTIENIVDQMDFMKIKKCTFVLDRGFYSEKNLSIISNHFENFLIPVPFSTTISKQILLRNSDMAKPENLFHFEGSALFYKHEKIALRNSSYFCNIYFDEQRRSLEINKFSKVISELDEKILNKNFRSLSKSKAFLKSESKDFYKMYNIKKEKNIFTIIENNEKRSEFINKMGKMLLISKAPVEKEKAISLYREKDRIEKSFDNLKNEIDQKRVRVSNSDSLSGKLFLNFLSLIVYSYISKIMKDKKIYNEMSFSALMKELNKIKIVKMSSKKIYLTEISKKQRNLFEAFKVDIPQNLVIKNAGI